MRIVPFMNKLLLAICNLKVQYENNYGKKPNFFL